MQVPGAGVVVKDLMPKEITRSGAPHFLCREYPQARIVQLGHRLGASASLQVQAQLLYSSGFSTGFSGLAGLRLGQTTGYPPITGVEQVRQGLAGAHPRPDWDISREEYARLDHDRSQPQ
jgi:hypothetical protein